MYLADQPRCPGALGTAVLGPPVFVVAPPPAAALAKWNLDPEMTEGLENVDYYLDASLAPQGKKSRKSHSNEPNTPSSPLRA